MPNLATHMPLPLILPWVDLTPLRGSTLWGQTVPSSAGVIPSLLSLANIEPCDNIGGVACDISYGLGGAVITEQRASSSSYPYISQVLSYDFITFGGDVNTNQIGTFYEMKTKDPIPITATPYANINFTARKYTSSSSSSSVVIDLPSPGFLTYKQRESYVETGLNLFSASGVDIGAANALTTHPWFQQNTPLILHATQGSAEVYLPEVLPVYRAFARKGGEPDVMLIGYQPSRPLASPPTLIERCTAVDHVTVGGRSYHMQHSRRKTWQIDLLLDGASDSGLITDGGPDGILDPLTTWNDFLKWAEVGVTIWIDRALGPGAFTRPRCYPYFPGMPNRIMGQLLDASQLRLTYDDGIARRYKVSLVIAEEDPWQ